MRAFPVRVAIAVAAAMIVSVGVIAKPARKKNGGARKGTPAVAVPAPKTATLAAEAAGGDDLAPSATSTAAQTKPQPPPWKPFNLYSLLLREDLVAELERRHAVRGTHAELLERITRGMVAAPYLLSPLGEGALPDPDPRMRLDAFDCTTFVETAIAFARCDELGDIERELDKIRYDGGVASFGTRRHLMVSQWVPGLAREGYVEDITEDVGGRDTKKMKLVLDEGRWKKRRIARSLVLPEGAVPRGTFELPYIPIAAMIDKVGAVPPGTILNVVRRDVAYSPDVITHQGLVLVRPREKLRIVRHASPVSKRVIDETLDHMMRRYLKHQSSWPIVGVNLLRVRDPVR